MNRLGDFGDETRVGVLGRWMRRNPLLPSCPAVLCCALSSLEPSCSAPISNIMSLGARASPALSHLSRGAGLWLGAMQWHCCHWRLEAEPLLERGKGRGWPAGPHSMPLARGEGSVLLGFRLEAYSQLRTSFQRCMQSFFCLDTCF